MNREDVLRMAKEVYGFGYWSLAQIDDLERFAAAIRSATKEEDARICYELKTGGGEGHSGVRAWAAGTIDCAEAIRASK